ncbi:MAG: hypothetical protein MJA30_18730 [Cytophagales bacterium]|nr:hypothetical protein [Cytophagales bacterium]
MKTQASQEIMRGTPAFTEAELEMMAAPWFIELIKNILKKSKLKSCMGKKMQPNLK